VRERNIYIRRERERERNIYIQIERERERETYNTERERELDEEKGG
jgi:hypothetical protein